MVAKKIRNIKPVLKRFVALLEQQISVEMVILYGSYARGAPRDWSDIDLVVVSPAFRGGTKDDYLLLSRVARKVTPQIEAIPFRPRDLNIYRKKMGVRL